jgi:hypothetical protein
MATALGSPFYRAIPLLQFVQFPWRFLSLVALGVAVLGAVGIGALLQGRSERVKWAAAAIVAAAAILFVGGILGPKPNSDLPSWGIDPVELRKSRETTSRGEYLPRWVEEQVKPRGFEDGVRVEGDAVIVAAARRAGRWDLTVDAAAPATITLVTTLAVGPSERTGHVQFEVPAGRHEVAARLAPTRLRTGTRVVSFAVLLAGLVSLGLKRRHS